MQIDSAWKSPLRRAFAALGYEVSRVDSRAPAEPAPRGPTGARLPLWSQDAAFQALRREIAGPAAVGEGASYLLCQFAEQVRTLPGDVAEVGVYKGGTARLLAKTVEPAGKTVHLFDTFAGMPNPDPAKDWHQAGDFADTSVEAVREYLADCPNVRLYAGLFPDTAGPIADARFCLVHTDVDIYPSVLACCEFFYPRLVRGGVLVFDDYARDSCPGATAAVDEFFADKPERLVYPPGLQAFVVKL